ncbi:hypothetical protein ABZ876_20115 [Streptomyces sp. NPDC046931]|uniref:hypothetical protein n=1 Tax=Streptomyces sp. NPDC046931 TaxID=3154806 RepID=UPI0033FE328A
MAGAAGAAAAASGGRLQRFGDLKAAHRLINQAGGGLTGGFAVLARSASTFDQAARTAGLTPSGWLDAVLIGTAYGPKASAALDRWPPAGRARCRRPVVLVENRKAP